ncbi:helix-turn-helix transcriptional regulator [Tenggerimyces flavus]|uniref:Helix-turn-helix transcriptional regulator n=1 Tax=Tenggerimyces flavus TaxID=1708749 RepID=A0ABV7Y6Y5_9ACTN|nr:helix-turn-helix transcriptional regulator [Tenggerimyces flavus]MBM7785479.1 DNA-binding CsgD family transcriptional regulator [Tenggerimyces flavus]
MTELVSQTFAGRVAELTVLEEAFASAVGGAPRVVLVGAEAGGGKSRLLQEFTQGVTDRARVLTGYCVELGEAGLPYSPITAALRELLRETSVADVQVLLSDGAGELAWLLPEFGAPPVGTDPLLARARLFEVLLRLFERLSSAQPLVLLVEDAHWADQSTRDLLSFLIGNLQGRVLLVASYRSDELHRAHPLRSFLAEVRRRSMVTSVQLPRLSRAEVASQLAGILQRQPEVAVVNAVYVLGDGVPLFTEALVDPDGTVRTELPSSLRDLLLGKVTELPEPTQYALRAAALDGVQVSHELLRRVIGADDANVLSAVRPAIAANVLLDAPGGYAFRHAMIREAVRSDLLSAERVGLHRAFAEALEADGTRPSARLAMHWKGAGADAKALLAAWHAAGEIASGLGYAEQLEMLDQVLYLWSSVPDASTLTGVDRIGVLELAVDAAMWAGQPDRGLVHVAAAIVDVDGERLASLLWRRAELREQLLQPGQLEDLREAVRLATSPSRLRAQALGELARMLNRHNARDEALPYAAELAALAESLGDDETTSESLITQVHMAIEADDKKITMLTAALEAAVRAGSPRLELLAYVALSHSNETRGRSREAVVAARAGLARAIQLGSARYVAEIIAQNLAESLFSAGEWNEALDVVTAALERDPAPYARAGLLLIRSQIVFARGDIESVKEILTEIGTVDFRPEAQHTLPLTALRIEGRLALGDLAGAQELAALAPTLVVGTDPRYAWRLLVASMRACAESPSPSLQASLTSLAEATDRPGPVEHAQALTFAAELSRVTTSSVPAWTAAAASWAELERPNAQTYALLRLAAAQGATGSRDAAAVSLREAVVLATGLGAEPLLAQASALARRLRLSLDDRPAPAEAATPYGLTDRELVVLRLVAAGRSNPEIAEELFISAKTASVHVSHILAKLGVTSRSAAAGMAHREHLVGND